MALDMHLIFTIVLLFHGIGHLIVLVIVGAMQKSFPSSWVLTDRLGWSETLVQAAGLLWFIVTAGFLVTGWAFWAEQEWWRLLAVPLVVLSMGLFILWWDAFPPNLPIQAVIGNIVVIAGILLL